MQVFSENDIKQLEALLKIKQEPGFFEKRLWEKVQKYTGFFHYIPGISCVCVCNSLAMSACHQNSDIDLFIITKKNRLWTARIFLTLFLGLSGQRKTAKHHAGKFCLSFFITEDALDFSTLAVKRDIYLAYWIKTLVSIYNTQECFEKFCNANRWYEFEGVSTHQTSPHPNPLLWRRGYELQKSQIFAAPFSSKGERIQDGGLRGEELGGGLQQRKKLGGELQLSEKFGNLLESLLKKIFLPRTQESFQKLGKPYGVIITDTILKFHPHDRRKTISQEIFPDS